MTLWPRSLGWRLAIAFAAGVAGVVVLALSVERAEAAAPQPAPRALPAGPTGLGFVLAPARGTVLLAPGLGSLSAGTAPVVQVLADGSVALRRPAPLPRAPGQSAAAAADAAIVLPGRSLRALGPGARAAVLDLIGQLVDVRPVPEARVRPVDLDCRPSELAVLLRWVR